MKKKLLSSIIIILILSVGLVNQVNAASNTTVKTESKIKQISLVNSPIISFENYKEKLADVKVKVKDNNKIKEVKIKEIKPKMDKDTIVLGVKGVGLLNVSDIGDKAVSWKSSDESIAKITLRSETRARITAKKAGKATITVMIDGKEVKSEIIVPEISPKSLVMSAGKSETFKLNYIDTKKAVTYKSSNEKIATVDKDGKVEGKNPGVAIITATYEGKTFKSKVTVMKEAKTSGYYYTTTNGYRIYYKKDGKTYKRLNGLTDYTASEDSKIYAGTNEILKAIGYDSKNDDFRVLIVADKDLKNSTLTVLAKDESGNYSIPVKTSLCVVPTNAKNLKEKLITGSADITKIAGQSKNVDVEESQNRQARQADWFEYSGKTLAPGTMSTTGGFYQSLFYNNKTDKKVLNNESYTEMGTAATSGSIRLYWQDLKWLYEHCQQDTVGRMIRSTKAFTPFGECTKIDPKTNTSQEKPNYTLSDKYESKLNDNSFDGVTFYNVGSYDTGRRWDYTQASTYSDGYYYATTLINYENGKQGNSILKFDSNFKLVKKNTDLNVVDKNSKNKIHGNGIVVGENKNELLMGFNRSNRVRVYDTKTLKYVKEKKIGGIGNSTGALVYEPKNNLYIQAFYTGMYVSKDGKRISKISRPKGELGQDICVVGDYIIETTYRESAINIYSIKRGCRVKKAQIKFNDVTVPQDKNSSEWSDFWARFEPEGICAVSNNEFVIMVARFKHGDSTRHIDFYKATIK